MSGEDRITRRELFKRAAVTGAAFYGLGKLAPGGLFADAAEAAARPGLVVAANQSPARLVSAAMAKLGGMGQFVRKGSTVVIKPNAGWAMPPTAAANTNPEVLAEVIRLCFEAGAKRVKVVEHPCDNPTVAFRANELQQTALRAGAQMISLADPGQYKSVSIPRGKTLKSAMLSKDIAEADVFINVPVAKVHSATTVTLGLKNLMGVVLDRQVWHMSPNLHQCIADFATVARPKLTIIDATRILLSNGPKGPGRTSEPKQVIAGTDPVAVDAYATRLFGMGPRQIKHIVAAHALGLGEIDPAKMRVQLA